MFPEHDIEFCTRREATERAAAEAATDPIARGIHTEIADRYAEQNRSLSISAVDGEVRISNVSGEVVSLTPNEAMDAADLLMATGREAAHEK